MTTKRGSLWPKGLAMRRRRARTGRPSPNGPAELYRPAVEVTSIVVGVDGNASGWTALEWAAREAARRNCPLRIVHIFTWPRLVMDPCGIIVANQWDSVSHEVAQVLLEDAAARASHIAPGLKPTTHAAGGCVPSALMQFGSEGTLLVLGRSRLVGPVSPIPWSVSWRAMRQSRGPVAIIGKQAFSSMLPREGTIVLGVGQASVSVAALEFAFRTAQLQGAGLTVVSAGPRSRRRPASGDGPKLQDCLPSWKAAFPDVDVNVRAYASSLRIGLVRECTGAGMVVIGGREPGRLHGLFIPGPEGDLVRSGCARIAVVRDMSARQHASRLARGVSQG